MNQIDPSTPSDVDELEELLSRPSDDVVRAMSNVKGDILVLGVGGKMGPTLARMARRASDGAGVARRVIGVSRFSSPGLDQRLNDWGVETIRCDLLDRASIDQLPDVENIVFMAGMKFGATENPSLTWAMNCHLPALVSERFRQSRWAVFSSGNVYGMTPTSGGGSAESDSPAPIGEYASTVLGRERMFEHFSRQYETPMVLLRLNYAVELRYGVLVDLAKRVLAGAPIDVSMGSANVIWQSEANAMALQSLLVAESPPRVLNIAGSEFFDLRDVGTHLGDLIGKPVHFSGTETGEAFLSNAETSHALFHRPRVTLEQMIRWTADWVLRGGDDLCKPTHFESRDGRY
ncbi:MAG TPA: NAD(P)-dependent oxidoreductase [Pirellulaceae bacterium]|nr:NAD(P)-dependent oxidoreductase [Pirellulaceae bacterium]